jgi:putative DNA primase/helicase
MTRPSALTIKIETIASELKSMDRWVLWRFVEKTKPSGEKVWTKVPFTSSGSYASSTNKATWCTYAEAFDAYLMGDYDGFGIVLGGNLHGIDLDDCRDPVTGSLSELAQETLDKVDGYAEVSPSGTGIKIFTMTNLDGSRTKKEAGVELYKDGRYFTITGHTLNGHASLPVLPQDLGWMIKRVWDEDLGVNDGGTSDDRAFELYKTTLDGWELDRVLGEVLVHLDPDSGYGEWLKVGAALHHQSGGDPEWLDAWDNWSSGSSKWVEGYCAEKWNSFSKQRATGRGAVTLASLLHMTKEKRSVAKLDKRDAAMKLVMDMVEQCTEIRDLQEKIAAGIAHTAEVSDVEREQIAIAIQSKAKDLGTKLPLSTVRGWVRARVKVSGGFVNLNDEGYPLCTLDNFYVLMDKLEYSVRYNVIKKAIELLIPNSAFTRDNRDNAAISHVLSECEKVRMPTKHVAQFLITLADKNQYNPVATWIDSSAWDGVSRLEAFYATVQVNAASERMKKKLIRKWMVQAVAAAFSADGIANQGILTFVGPQNIGKTTWFQRLAPASLDAILTGHTLDMRSKDSIFIALSYWIVELGELDATFSKSEISALKSFTTQSMDKLRRPYAATESNFGRRTVFGGTVNESQYLNDPTGNRRFWSIEVDGFDLDHSIDMQQVWAEIKEVWLGGEQWSLNKHEVAELNTHNEEFTVADPIEERLAVAFNWSDLGLTDELWVTATDALMKIGVRDPSKGQTITAGRVLKKLNGGQRKKTNGRVVFLVPADESEFTG